MRNHYSKDGRSTKQDMWGPALEKLVSWGEEEVGESGESRGGEGRADHQQINPERVGCYVESNVGDGRQCPAVC